MTESLRRCFRCMGAKKMYEMNGGYSSIDMGGAKVDCPLCAGKGKIPKVIPAEEVILSEHTAEDVKKNLEVKEKVKRKAKRVSSEAESAFLL